MTKRLEIELSGDASKLIGELKKSGVAVKEFSGEGEKASKSSQMLGGSITDLAKTYGPALGIAAVTTQIISYGKEASNMAAVNGRLSDSGEKLAAKYGESYDQIIGIMQEASGYTINRMDAVRLANQAMQLGVARTPEDFEKLTAGAVASARVVGGTTTKAFEDLTIGIGRNSREVLDNQGIIVDAASAQAAYAQQIGKSVSELTDAEAKEAFRVATLEQLGETVETLGGIQADHIAQLEEMNARMVDVQIASGEVINKFIEVTGAFEGANTVLEYATGNIESVSNALDKGLLPGLVSWYDSINPITQGMELLGLDLIPDVAKASEEAVKPIEAMAEAHAATTDEINKQVDATNNLLLVTGGGIADLAGLEEDYNKKKQDLLQGRLKAEDEAAKATAKNQSDLNQKLNELNTEHGTQTAEQIAKKKEQLIKSYNEENTEIQARLKERQADIDAQLKKEEEAYKKRADELKLLIAARALEATGQLEELTGIAGITASEFVELAKAGAIDMNKQTEIALEQQLDSFNLAQGKAKTVAERNQKDIERILGESLTSIEGAHNRQTSNAVSNWDRQRKAAEQAVPPLFRPGSPTPFEIGLRGIADAADAVSTGMEKMGGSIIGAAASASQLDKAMEATKNWWGTAAGKAYAKQMGVGRNKGGVDQAKSDLDFLRDLKGSLIDDEHVFGSHKLERFSQSAIEKAKKNFYSGGNNVLQAGGILRQDGEIGFFDSSRAPNESTNVTNNRYFNYSPTYNGVSNSNPEMDYYLMNSLAG